VPSVVLVGFMATGKSAVGRLVAARLGLPFVDTDAVIERHAGGIAEIFATQGEQAFRRIEREAVAAALSRARDEGGVIALGGGSVTSVEVRTALRRMPLVVWLSAPGDVLWRRASSKDALQRPLAVDREAFTRLLEQRSSLYLDVATTVVVNDGSRSEEDVAGEIVAAVLARHGDAVAERGGARTRQGYG
jgi:shikimate kinase